MTSHFYLVMNENWIGDRMQLRSNRSNRLGSRQLEMPGGQTKRCYMNASSLSLVPSVSLYRGRQRVLQCDVSCA